MLQDYTEMSVKDVGICEGLHESREEHRRMISRCVRSCNSGNRGARETVRELIEMYLVRELKISREEVLRMIPFNDPKQMTPWQQFEVLIFDMEHENESYGFRRLCELYGWGKDTYTVSHQEISRAYMNKNPVLTYDEELKVLVQLLYAETVGLGIIDTLNYQKGSLEEIQIGMSGQVEQQYDYNTFFREDNAREICRVGIHVMVRGTTIWLKALSFETEKDVQRVLRNLIQDAGNGELTKNHPMLVVDTVDGRRISVSRPPMTEAWAGLIRKFDTIKEVSLEKLFSVYEKEKIVPQLLRQLVRSGRNMAITGEMASGKTTLFRACLAETRQDMNIRVIEADSFELNIRSFLPKANSLTMRVTERTPSEEVLAFARKTTGQIFAIGEINSASMAMMAMDLSKIASQLFFSAHYITTEHMIADFVNAKLCNGGYSEELLAELDVVRCLGFDVHLRVKQGRRYVQRITEIVPKLNKQQHKYSTYEIRPIYQYDEEKEQGVLLNSPSEITYERAKQVLGKEEYLEFVRFFAG